MTVRTVTGVVRHPRTTEDVEAGDPWVGVAVLFRLETAAISADATYPRDKVSVTTDEDGAFSVDLASGLASRWICQIPGTPTFAFVLEPGDTPVSIETLRAIAGIETPITNEVQVALDAGFAAFSDELATLTAMLTEIDGGGPGTDYDTLTIDGGSL
jgi:hypothetical protein